MFPPSVLTLLAVIGTVSPKKPPPALSVWLTVYTAADAACTRALVAVAAAARRPRRSFVM
jgi:hypothetical protein